VSLRKAVRVARPVSMAKNILVIEDNADIAHLVMVNLRSKQMHVEHASDGTVGLDMALTGQYHLMILDLMLPGMDGLNICRKLRSEKVYTPVLMLTARTTELDRVLGLEVGADDYVTKPFSVPELVARVNAILRRPDQYQSSQATRSSSSLQFGELRVDPGKRQVQLGGINIELTAKEFDLLLHFASNPGRVFTRSQLLDSVWGYGHVGYEHTVNSHINRLRAKIEADFSHSQRLGRMMEELFELVRLDSCESVVFSEPFSMCELVQDVTQKFQFRAREKSIQLNASLNRRAPQIYGDIAMMQRVLENLLENGLRHTPAGGSIIVGVDVDSGNVVVQVADTGCGIPAEDVPRIFDRFYQRDKNRSVSNSAGLGLAIVKRILDLHGSVIKVSSEIERGTTFSFRIPV